MDNHLHADIKILNVDRLDHLLIRIHIQHGKAIVEREGIISILHCRICFQSKIFCHQGREAIISILHCRICFQRYLGVAAQNLSWPIRICLRQGWVFLLGLQEKIIQRYISFLAVRKLWQPLHWFFLFSNNFSTHLYIYIFDQNHSCGQFLQRYSLFN